MNNEEYAKILVVGGNSGIGEATVRRLTRRYPYAEIIVPNVMEEHGRAVYELDVRSEPSIEKYLKEHGPFQYIVYTPGVNNPVFVEDLTSEQMHDDFAVNAFGFALLLGAHSRMFGRHELVSSVAITSDASRNPMRGSTSYCGSKAALEHIIRTIAREWMPDSRVNGVAPAAVEGTPMSDRIDALVPALRGWTPEQAKSYEMTQLPMKRRVETDELAHVIENTLFGPDYQTGSIVHVTGGK